MCVFALMNFVWAALASLLRSLSLVAKSRGYSLVVVRGLLTAAVSLVMEHRL